MQHRHGNLKFRNQFDWTSNNEHGNQMDGLGSPGLRPMALPVVRTFQPIPDQHTIRLFFE